MINETTTEQLKAEIDGSLDNSEDAGLDSSERRERRYYILLPITMFKFYNI